MVWLKLSPRHHMLLLRNVFVCVLVLVWFSNVPRERRKEGRERSLWWLFVCIHFKIEFVRVCDIFFPPFHSAYSSRRRMRWTESKNESSSNNNTFRNNLIWNLIVTFFPGSFFSLNELWNSGSSFWLHFIPMFPDYFFFLRHHQLNKKKWSRILVERLKISSFRPRGVWWHQISMAFYTRSFLENNRSVDLAGVNVPRNSGNKIY